MAKKYSKVTPHFMIRNPSLRLKREITNIAKSKGKDCSQFVREVLIKIRDDATERERTYLDNDCPC